MMKLFALMFDADFNHTVLYSFTPVAHGKIFCGGQLAIALQSRVLGLSLFW